MHSSSSLVWPLRKLPLVASMKRAYRNDPIGYGEALRKCVKNICVAKMRTNAFLTTIGQLCIRDRNMAIRACPNACCLRSRARLTTARRRPATLSSGVWDALTVL